MGSTFSNMSVLKSKTVTTDKLKDFIVSHMKAEGVILSDNDSDGSKKIIIRNNPESKWFTIYNDNEDYEFLDNFSVLLSKMFNTYSMSIINMDSDFMIIKLTCGGKKKDAVIVGEPYDDIIPAEKARGSIDAWKKISDNPVKLIEAFKENYVCSEDVLASLQEEVGVSANDIATHFEIAEDTSHDIVLYSFLKSENSDFIKNGDPVIEPYNSFGWEPKKEINRPCRYCYINRGGISKGAAVIISGTFLKNSDVKIEEIHIQRGRSMDSEFFLGDNAMFFRSRAERKYNNNGEPYLFSCFPDFEFPEGMNKNCRTFEGQELQITERRHLMCVSFMLCGLSQSDLSDMEVLLQPVSI